VAHALFFRREQKKTQRRKKREIYHHPLFRIHSYAMAPCDFEQKREETLFSKAEKR
jgi:hypothetical protein